MDKNQLELLRIAVDLARYQGAKTIQMSVETMGLMIEEMEALNSDTFEYERDIEKLETQLEACYFQIAELEDELLNTSEKAVA